MAKTMNVPATAVLIGSVGACMIGGAIWKYMSTKKKPSVKQTANGTKPPAIKITSTPANGATSLVEKHAALGSVMKTLRLCDSSPHVLYHGIVRNLEELLRLDLLTKTIEPGDAGHSTKYPVLIYKVICCHSKIIHALAKLRNKMILHPSPLTQRRFDSDLQLIQKIVENIRHNCHTRMLANTI